MAIATSTCRLEPGYPWPGQQQHAAAVRLQLASTRFDHAVEPFRIGGRAAEVGAIRSAIVPESATPMNFEVCLTEPRAADALFTTVMPRNAAAG